MIYTTGAGATEDAGDYKFQIECETAIRTLKPKNFTFESVCALQIATQNSEKHFTVSDFAPKA